jgi:hypothetical protein
MREVKVNTNLRDIVEKEQNRQFLGKHAKNEAMLCSRNALSLCSPEARLWSA